MAGDKFTLEIFADTSAAESALKRFAQNQKALARDLAKPQTAQSKVTAPQILGGAREAGQLSRQVAFAEKQGVISSEDAARYRTQIKGIVAEFKRDLASLGVEDAGAEIDKAYRNGAAQARRAFKKISESGEKLSDSQERQARATDAETRASRAATAERVKANVEASRKIREQARPGRFDGTYQDSPDISRKLYREADSLYRGAGREDQSVVEKNTEKTRAETAGIKAEREAARQTEEATAEQRILDEKEQAATRKAIAAKLLKVKTDLAAAVDPEVQAAQTERARLNALNRNRASTAVAVDPQVQQALTDRLAAQKISKSTANAEALARPAVVKAMYEEAVQRQITSNDIRASRAVNKEVTESAVRMKGAQDAQTRQIRKNLIAQQRAGGAGTLFQRGYSRLTGQPPLDAPTGGQFFGRKLATTAGYGITAAASYAVVGGIAKSIKEAEELDRVMNDIGFQLDSFRDREDIKFDIPSTDQVRGQILQIARDTGLAADEVGRVAFQLQGAFGGDVVRSMRETAAAAEFVRITGQSLEETVDAFTALTQSFEDGQLSARDFGDTAFGLQERFGVLAKEIQAFAADLAPVAAATGFTVQELEALGAAAQKFSGRSGSQLAEAFGRIIPQVQERAGEFIGLFRDTPGLRQFSDELTNAFSSNDIQGVFQVLIEAYGQMSGAQQSLIVDMLGGRREAAALIGVLENGDEILKEWNNTFNDTGKQSERFTAFNQTLNQQLAKFGEQLTQLGIDIFESGFKDLLEFILASGGQVVGLLGQLTGAFGALNGAIPGGYGDAFEGLPGKILAVVAAMKLLQAASKTALAGRLAGAVPFAGGGGLGSTISRGFLTQANQGLAAQRATQALGYYGPPIPAPILQSAYQGGTAPQPPTTIRGAINDQGVRATGRAAAQNTAAGIRKGFENNKGVLIATGLIIGASIIDSIAEQVQETAIRNAQAEFEGLSERLASGGTLSDSERRRLERAKYGVDNQTAQELQDARTLANIPGIGYLTGKPALALSGSDLQTEAEQTEARRILNAQTSGTLQQQIDQIAEAGLLGVQDGLQVFASEDGTLDASDEINTDEIRQIIDKAAAGGELNTQEQQIYDYILMLSEKGFQGVQAIVDLFNGTQEEQNFGTATQTLEAVTARYEAGDASRGEYMAALARAASGARELIDAGAATDEQMVTSLEAIEKFRQEVSQALLSSIELANQYRAIRTGNEDPARLASQLLTAIGSGDLNAEDTKTAVDQYFAAQRELLQLRIDAADSVAEANRIARRGIANSPVARAAAIGAQLELDPQFQAFFENLGDGAALGLGGLEQFSEDVSDLMIAWGIGAKEAALIAINGAIDLAQAGLEAAAASGAGTAGFEVAVRALQELKRSRRALLNGDLDSVSPEDPDRTRAEVQDAEEEAASRALDAMDSRFALMESLTEDPVALAEIAVRRAREALRLADTPTEIRNAQAELNNAQTALRHSIEDVYDSQFELLESTTEDPVKLARYALQRAQEELRRAQATGDQAAINRALAAINEANRGVRSALQEAFDAQTSLLIAIADAAGNTVRSARLALQQAQRDLRRLRDQDAGTAAIRNARAQVVASQAGVRDALLARRQDHYQFLYDMGRITTGQLVSYLQSLLSIPDLTRQQIQDIQLQIRNLRQELGQDFQFNLPTELALPTLFEVRRADQSGGRNFTDNRQVTINVEVGSNVDLAALESVLAANVGANVNGTIPRRY